MRREIIDRVMVYIDGSNFYHSLQSSCGRTDVDYEKFGSKLTGNRRLVRMYYYGARIDRTKQPNPYREQQRFLSALENIPRLELRLGQLIYRNWPTEGPFEKGVDIKLATDMIIHASRDNYDVAVLVSGDTDFVDMVQAVKDLGKNVEVALFGRGTSRALREVADRVVSVDDTFLADCWR